MLTDLTESELALYRSSQVDPDDFDSFWADTLAHSRSFDLGVTVERVDTGLTTLDVFDVSFAGYDGQPIKAWLRMPAGTATPLPAVVQYVGYGGGRGEPTENLLWASAGYAHFHMDTRGQGSSWSTGGTADPEGSGPQIPGFMTRGIENRDSYYYRRLITDAVRAVEAARTLQLVDSSRVAVLGGSQGGGLALAVAGLVPDISAVIAFVPFMCDYPRATRITDNDPYREIARYLAVHRDRVAQVHDTLAYFDNVNFAKRAQASAWFTAALMDPTCPPSTIFGAYHNYAGEKQMTVWPYNGHEGGEGQDDALALWALAAAFASAGDVG